MTRERLRGAEADGEDRAEHDRDLAEDLAGIAHADDALDAVGLLDRLDAALEDGEQRTLAALRRGVLARGEADVGGGPREPLARAASRPANSGTSPISSAVTIGRP